MHFNREEVGTKSLFGGVYLVSIDDITRRSTKAGQELWNITVKSDDGKTSRATFFDNGDDKDKYQENKSANDVWLERMLASIYDAGFSIPDADYTFDNVDQFLSSKPYKAYVKVRPQKNNPQYNEAIFITKDVFDNEISKELEDKGISDTPNPFAGGTEVKDNPFA